VNDAKSAIVRPAQPGKAAPQIKPGSHRKRRTRGAAKRMSTLKSGVPPRMPDTIMPRPKIFPPAVGDHCYLRHGDRALMARVFMPRGDTGPFPCLIDLHGGGWQRGDLEYRNGFGQYAGHVGCVIVALNFRQGADAYPSSLVDINYGIRWVKANTSARVTQHMCNESSTYGIRRKRVSRLCPA